MKIIVVILRRKRRAATESVEVGAEFAATEISTADTAEVQSNLTAALNDVNNTLTAENYTLSATPAELVTAFTAKVQDKCQAENATVCPDRYKCVNSTCFHKCEFFTCSDRGKCYLESFPDDSIPTQPRCSCESDEVYDYSGDHCEDKALRTRWVGGIVGGVLGLLLMVLLLVLVAVCWYRHRDKAYDSSLENNSEDGYQRTYMAPRYRPEYDNAGFQKGAGDMYFPPQHIDDILSPFYDSGTPGSKAKFQIQRPKVSSEPMSIT